MKSKAFYNLISFAIFAVFLAIWQFASVLPRIKFFFGSPLLIFQSMTQNASLLLSDTFITGFEVLAGFLIGILLGVIIGFLMWYSPLIAKIAKPYIFIAGAVPIFAFAPIVILWFGIGITMKIAMAAFGAFLITLTQAYEGANSVDLEEYRLLKTFNASRFQILSKIIFPASLSWVLSSIRLSIGFSLLGAFIGDFI